MLTWTPESPLRNVTALRMATLESPSRPEWLEMEVDATPE